MATIAVEDRRGMVARPTPRKQVPPSRATILTRAETAECTCPEACERDHEND